MINFKFNQIIYFLLLARDIPWSDLLRDIRLGGGGHYLLQVCSNFQVKFGKTYFTLVSAVCLGESWCPVELTVTKASFTRGLSLIADFFWLCTPSQLVPIPEHWVQVGWADLHCTWPESRAQLHQVGYRPPPPPPPSPSLCRLPTATKGHTESAASGGLWSLPI